MKNTRFASILSSSLVASALAIGSLASTQFASAQSPRPVADVTVPFAFHIAKQTLPAGTYRVILESPDIIYLRGSGSTGGMVVIHSAVRTRATNRGVAVFARYGDKYYLRQIWTRGDPAGLELAKSRAEEQSMVAENMQAPSSVELALNSIPKQ